MSEPNAPKLCPNYPAHAPHNCAGVAGQVGPDGSTYVCTFCADVRKGNLMLNSKLRVVDVSPMRAEIVELAEGEWKTYMRHAADHWDVLMGESWETELSSGTCAELEAAYQEYQHANQA